MLSNSTNSNREVKDDETEKEFNNGGKRIDEVSDKNSHRVLKRLASRAEKALCFAETYGMISKSLTVETFDGELKKISLDGTDSKRTYFA